MVNPVEMYVEECAEDFRDTLRNIIAERALRSGVDINDIGGTELDEIITELLTDALRRDNFRILSFADKGNTANTDYDQTIGLWPRLISESGPG